jgi:TRAP-type C4-dicarboxylate transport system permease small subunit
VLWRVIAAVRWLQTRLAMLALVAMMLVTVLDVAMRYVAGRPVVGAYALVECCLAIFVFHGISATFIGRRNIVIDLIDVIAPRPLLAVLIRVADLLSVGCLLVIGWAMIDPMLQAWDYGDAKPQLGLPLIVLWAAALLGVAGTILSALATTLEPLPK